MPTFNNELIQILDHIEGNGFFVTSGVENFVLPDMINR